MNVIKKVLDIYKKFLSTIYCIKNGSEYSITNYLPVQQLPNNNGNWIYYQNLGPKINNKQFFPILRQY